MRLQTGLLSSEPGEAVPRYTGRELDVDTGLYYYRARYYDPRIGRFLTEDPLGFAAGVNFYAYVENNPINANDPSGQVAQVPIGAAIGFVSSLGTELILSGGDVSQVNWWNVAGGTVAGGLTGGLSAITSSAVRSAGTAATVNLTGSALAGVAGNSISRTGRGLPPFDPIQTPAAATLGLIGGGTGLLVSATAAPAIEAGAVSPLMVDLLAGAASFEVALPFEIAASQLPTSSSSSAPSGCGSCPGGSNLGPGPWAPGASGGFVLYPSKPNLNMVESVYSK